MLKTILWNFYTFHIFLAAYAMLIISSAESDFSNFYVVSIQNHIVFSESRRDTSVKPHVPAYGLVGECLKCAVGKE